MPIYELYSERKRQAANRDVLDVYQYEDIPKTLRVQVRKLLEEGLGSSSHGTGSSRTPNSAYQSIVDILCREYGLDHIGTKSGGHSDLMHFLDRCSTDEFLDAVELGCRMIDKVVRNQSEYILEAWNRTTQPDELLSELNHRFRRAGVGYQFENGRIVRVDSQLLHAEVTKPALGLLNKSGYEGPQQEFLSAHEHFRQGRYNEAITEAAKAFESMMKAICHRKGWDFPSGARASDLLKVLRRNRLWPAYLDGSFDQLVATLQSGLPQVRNEQAAHGQGPVPLETPQFVAGYALHLAASKIVLLAEAAALVADAPEAAEGNTLATSA